MWENILLSFAAVLLTVASGNGAPSEIDNELSKFDAITDEFIGKINSMQQSWTAGYNFPPGTKFSDLKILAGTKRQRPPVIKEIDVPNSVVIPKSFDARENWPNCKSIKEIKNQGHCGSCWAVSSATTMSDRLCISSKGKFNSDVSAQQIISCSEINGCHGGLPYAAWNYFVEHGAVTGGDYHSNDGCQPYLVKPCINRTADSDDNSHPEQCPSTDYVKTPKCQSKCYNHRYHKSYTKDLHKAKQVFGVPQNITQIQLNIMTYGPVVADFDVYADFMTYKSGVYEHHFGKILGGHAIRIIGWGEENGKDYWLITNQWGKEWGNEGTVKFLRGKNELGIEEDVVSGITGDI
ncbi:cathepsin B-like [Lycorma delicatula]|uniref:cathepsin B-like n=1 Tax=Lycorma delicatula TaxID=130591 RepID=UPI003F511CBC